MAVLHVMRIEVDDDQHGVGAVGRRLAVGDDLGVVGRVEAQRPIGLQRRMLAADLVDARDQLLDVPGPIPVPVPELVLLRVGVLLGAGHRLRLAQLEAAVDAVARAERRRQQQPRLERRTAAVLQVGVQDVGRVREQVRPQVLARPRSSVSSVKYSVSSALVFRHVK